MKISSIWRLIGSIPPWFTLRRFYPILASVSYVITLIIAFFFPLPTKIHIYFLSIWFIHHIIALCTCLLIYFFPCAFIPSHTYFFFFIFRSGFYFFQPLYFAHKKILSISSLFLFPCRFILVYPIFHPFYW